MGAQRVVFSLLMAKVIPISRRGRLHAWRNATGGAIGAGLAYFAGRWFIGPNLFGTATGVTFIFAFFLTSMGLWACSSCSRSRSRPPPAPEPVPRTGCGSSRG